MAVLADRKPSAVKSSGILIVSTLTASSFGLVTQFVYARAFGTTYKMDSLWLSLAIVTVFQLGISAAFNPTLVPALAQMPADSRQRDALIKRFIKLAGGLSALFVALLVLLADPFVAYLAPGFSETQQALTVTLLRIQAPSVIFLTVSATVATWFFAGKQFTTPSLSAVVNGFVVLAVAVVAIPRLGIHGATLGYPLAYFAQMVVFIPTLARIWKTPVRLVSNIEFSTVLRTLGWLAVVAFLLNMYVVVERNIASHLPEGAISYLGYGYRFIYLLNMMFISTLAVYLLPQFSETLQGDSAERGTTVLTSYKMSMIVSAPLVMGGIACIHYVIFLFLQHGAFTADDSRQLTYTIWAYGLGAFIIGNGGTLTSAIHALRRPKALILAAVGALVVWLPFAVYAARHYQHLGIAAAYFFYSATLVLLQSWHLRAEVGLKLRGVVSFTAVNLVIGITLWAGFNALAPERFETIKDQLLYVVLAAFGLALHYALLLIVFRHERATKKVLMNFRSLLGK